MAKIKLPKIEDLFDAGVHFGHQVRRWHPNMEPYIFGVRSGIHIIDLEKTHEKLEEAAEVLYEVAKTGGQIIFVGTKRQAKDIIELEAKRSGALFVTERWLGGTITNYRIIKKNMDKLTELIRRKNEGGFSHYTKKERLLIDREIEKLDSLVGGIVPLQGKPAAVFVVDARREATAIREARRSGIPTIALIDTNSNPKEVDHIVPGNDDAIRSIATIVKVLADAVESGYEDYAKAGIKEAEKKEQDKKDQEEKAKVEVKVTSSEAAHASKEAGKDYAKKVEKGEEEVENEKSVEKEPKKETVKDKKKKATKKSEKKDSK